jgi:hypothetical protein
MNGNALNEGVGRAFWSGARWALGPAILVALAYALACLAGLRQDTAFLSGTMVDGDWNRTVSLGGVYLAAYFAWTVAAPILAIAGTLTGAIAVWKKPLRTVPDRE